ncbi:MAG TPA: FAD-dependent oxidoreductase [Candidatus Onthocola gallistercoris]|uniref:FAD-dependent oxidoreductase n=1 Tax=Candidatus Onthocola gallistercoris TaxID=2840876 RepID=A0A9D1HFS6_9FIRM|nr:FAD-dependent oxidoreductase [Candidatus Onthocola gallistercoris]
MSKTVIIGGVAAGATAAARLRRLDEDMEIIILEKGSYISYANCGLPYYIGGVIKDREALLIQTPESMRSRYRLDVRTRQQAIKIDPEAKTVQVKKKDGTIYEESYDQLIIATGSSPYKPNIPGIDSEGIYTLWTVPDTDAIYQRIEKERIKRVTVIGGGFIGLEMAENLQERGLDVTLIEVTSQVMPPLDMDMAGFLHEHISKKGVHLYTGASVTGFEKKKKGLSIYLANGEEISADMVLLSIGVRPNSKIAREAGILLGDRGGIKVDEYMRTSEPDIWAVGDVAEIKNLVTGNPAMIPLAGPANKQGRIAANDICQLDGETYDGSLGTSVVKIFDLTAASVGINEKMLRSDGKLKGKDYEVVLINQKSHATYYPGAKSMILKLIFTMEGQILGAQIVGLEGVDKRIDTIATVMRMKGSVRDLEKLELSYAPPFSSAKDPVNMAGYVADNILKGLVSFVMPTELTKDMALVDVREDWEVAGEDMTGIFHIPLGQLRERINGLPKDRTLVIRCGVGVRAYNAARILMQNGFGSVKVLAGGMSFFKSPF